jgi:hypothetical protein
MQNTLIGYDANFTDGSKPGKMDALYEDDQHQVSRVGMNKMITLSLSKPSIAAGGVDLAILNISTSKTTVTVILTQDRESVQIDVPITAGVGALDITSDFAGKIQIDCTDLCETIYLSVQ